MATIIYLLIASAGANSLLMPASPIGLVTGFSTAKEAEAIFYNPANFAASDDFKLWCFYNRFYVSMQSVSLVLSKKIKAFDFGLAINNFDYGNDFEWHPDYPTEDTLTFYGANDLSITLSSGIKISNRGKIGFSIKYIYENIYTYADYAFAFDLAFAYSNSISGISFGTSNLGSRVTLNNEDVNLPTRISIGGFHSFNKLVLSADMHYLVNNGSEEFSVGLSLPIYKILTLGGAINYRESFYPGFGVTINAGEWAIKYGTAFYPKDLGMVNTIGIGFDF